MELERGEQRSLSAASGIRKLFPTARWKGRKTTPSASSPTTQSLHRGHVLEFTDLQNLGRAIVCEGGLSGFKAELSGSLLFREEKSPALSTGCSTPLRGEGMIFIFLREAKFQQPVYTVLPFLTLFYLLPCAPVPGPDGLLMNRSVNERRH